MEQRIEHKFLVPESLRGPLRAAIHPFVRPDAHARPRAAHGGYAGYTVRSLYYDTSKFAHYFANEDGLPVRAKPRIRGYDQPEADASVFLEVKKRHGVVGTKARAPVPLARLADLLSTGDLQALPANSGFPDAVRDGREFLCRLRRHGLSPVIAVVYEREPFVGAVESSLRVTFDSDVRSVPFPRLAGLFDEPRPRSSLRGHFILEVKHDARLGFPIWLRPFLSTHGIVRRALSKYAICLMEQGIVRGHTRTMSLARAERGWRAAGEAVQMTEREALWCRS